MKSHFLSALFLPVWWFGGSQASKARYEAVLSISAEQLVRASRRMYEKRGILSEKPEKSGIFHDFSRKNKEKLWHFPRRWRFIMIYQM